MLRRSTGRALFLVQYKCSDETTPNSSLIPSVHIHSTSSAYQKADTRTVTTGGFGKQQWGRAVVYTAGRALPWKVFGESLTFLLHTECTALEPQPKRCR